MSLNLVTWPATGKAAGVFGIAVLAGGITWGVSQSAQTSSTAAGSSPAAGQPAANEQ